VHINPPEAVAAGAGWRLRGWGTGYHTNSNYTEAIPQGSNAVIECVGEHGWVGPINQSVSVTLGELTVFDAVYTRPGRLEVSPATGHTFSNYAGGSLTADSISYTLTNSGYASLNWWVGTPNWLTVSAAEGTLAPGQSTSLSVSLNANVNALPPDSYLGYLTFANLENDLGNAVYPVRLVVQVHSPVQFTGVNLLTDGALAMTLQGVAGGVYSIVASTNLLDPLTHWSELRRLTNSGGQTTFTNPPPLVSPQYYRAKEL
jgi:hypothetical protein